MQRILAGTCPVPENPSVSPDGSIARANGIPVKAVSQHEGKEKAMEAVFRLYNQYVYPGQATLGAMDADRLASLQDFYVDQGIVRAKVPVEDLYTNRFVE